jgi:hypothetical protein
MNKQSEKLLEWARGVEYYADAYVGDDAPFANQKPHVDEVCKQIQDGAHLVFDFFRSMKETNVSENREEELEEDLNLLLEEKLELKQSNFYNRSELVVMVNILLSKLQISLETGHWVGQDKAHEALHYIIEKAQSALG